MFDHIGLKVADLERSTRFYAAALEPLGLVVCARDPQYVGIGSPDVPALWLYAAERPSTPIHLAFKARQRSQVEHFYEQGRQHGGADNGAPGVRSDYSPNYFAAFLIDPDGHNIEAVCME